jgi:hypothetical protein
MKAYDYFPRIATAFLELCEENKKLEEDLRIAREVIEKASKEFGVQSMITLRNYLARLSQKQL